MTLKRVYHFVDLDDSDHWCEGCINAPKGVKVYIDEYKGCNPSFWCEKCVHGGLGSVKFEVIGWLNREEYLEHQKNYVSKNWPKY